MKNAGWKYRTMLVFFWISLAAVILNLAWDFFGKTSPFYYNIAIGTIMAGYCVLHGTRYFGPFRTGALFAITAIVSFCMEFAGVKTGLIYGEYHYGTVLGPKILDTVPFLIPLSWFFFLYPCVILTNEILDGSKTLHRLLGGGASVPATLVYAAVDSIALTAMDILVDPIWVSRGTWTWTGLGSLPPERIFYGIPVQNFFGWLLTSFIIFALFRTIFFRQKKAFAGKDRAYFLAVISYCAGFVVGTIEAWTVLSNTGVMFVAVMTLGLFCLVGIYRMLAFYRETG